MHKSTVIFAFLTAVFASTTIAVALLYHQAGKEGVPAVQGANIQFGLPTSGTAGERRVFNAQSAVLWDKSRKTISFEQNGFERMPIASLTKLMTAMVALDHGIDWEHAAAIQPEEYVQGGRLLLHPGENVTMKDLFHASLLGSANNATLAYVREMGLSKEEFVQAMNRKSVSLGLEQTEFVDVTGLDPDNVSTAYEVARIAEYAFDHYPEMAEITSRSEYQMVTSSGREHIIRNTNKLVSEYGEVISGGKTGYLYESKYCLVAAGAGELSDRIAVILGSPSEFENFADTRKLLHLAVP